MRGTLQFITFYDVIVYLLMLKIEYESHVYNNCRMGINSSVCFSVEVFLTLCDMGGSNIEAFRLKYSKEYSSTIGCRGLKIIFLANLKCIFAISFLHKV